MRAVIGGCLVAASLATSPAHGDIAQNAPSPLVLAEWFLQAYKSEHKEGERGYFSGFAEGVINTLEQGRDYCPPKKLNMSQDVILQAFELGTRQARNAFMRRAVLPEKVSSVILGGLRELFPCN